MENFVYIELRITGSTRTFCLPSCGLVTTSVLSAPSPRDTATAGRTQEPDFEGLQICFPADKDQQRHLIQGILASRFGTETVIGVITRQNGVEQHHRRKGRRGATR